MSKPNRPFVPFIFFFLFSTSIFSPKLPVFGSPTQEPTFKQRPDPLQNFKNYNGCYDPRNMHYWASAAFTGVYGYTIGAVWILCGLIFGVYAISTKQICSDFLDHHYFVMFILILLLTILVLIASGFVLAANHASMKRAERLKGTVLKAGGDAYEIILKVLATLTKMQLMLDPYTPEATENLNMTCHKLEREAMMIHSFVRENEPYIDLAINSSYMTHLVVVTVNLVLLVGALVLLLLHWHPGFIIIIFVCWILTTLCWVLSGFDFSLHIFAEDTCSAIQDYEKNPSNNSFSSMLPCLNTTASEKIMVEIGSTAHTFISELNSRIAELYKDVGVDQQTEEAMGVKEICVCDPFSGSSNYGYAPGHCPEDAIDIGELPNVLARFTCYEDSDTKVSKHCMSSGKFIPESSYKMAWAFSGSLQDLLEIYPDIQKLSECSIVKDTFYEVFAHQCRPFNVSIELLWCSMLCLSIFMVFLVLVLVVKAYQDRGRSFSLCSIIPTGTAQA